MKNNRNKSKSPDSRAVRSKNRWRRLLRLAGFALILAVLLALLSLFAGLPPQAVKRITAKIKTAGIPLQIESIRLSLHHGWVLHQVQLYSTSPDDLRPLLNARKLYVAFWPVDWGNPLKGGMNIRLYARDLDISLGHAWENRLAETSPYRTVTRLDVSLTAMPGQLIIREAAASWDSINLRAHGTVSLSEKPRFKPNVDVSRYAVPLMNLLNQLRFTSPPQVNLDFNYNSNRPEETFLNVSLAIKDLGWRDRIYKNLSGALEYRNAVWTLSTLQLSQSVKEALVARGEFDTAGGLTQLWVENSLPAAELFALLPEKVQSAIAQTEAVPYGRFDFSASAGPAPYSQLAEKFEIQINRAQVTRLDLSLDPVSLRIVRDGTRLNASNIQAIANGKPLTGSFAYNLSSHAWNATVKTQCDPTPIGTLTGGGLQKFIGRFRFPDELLNGDLTLSQSGPDAPFFASGTLSANRFTCAGVPIEHFDTFMVLSNGILHLSPLHIIRGQERFDGSVQVDLDGECARFDATNSFPPVDIAQALAPDTHTFLNEIRLTGPVYAVGSGQLDYGTWTNHAFQGTVRADTIGLGKIQASRFQSEVEGRGSQLLFKNASAALYGGSVEGSAEFDIFAEDGSAPYRIDARLEKLDLVTLLRQLSSSDFGRTRGELSTTIDLSADAKADFWRSAKGRGQTKIENGYLADIPFFGGFSRLVQSTIPGFSLFTLTSFSADYDLRGGIISSENVKLGGSVFSASGHGHYSPKTGLNFLLTSEPLKQTETGAKEWYELQLWAAAALKMGTSPFFRLLEIQLTGPLDKPQWNFINLPGEFLDLFKSSK
ncbi:MAG: hypothetical protein MUC65_04275 [Pontiellaceae bacterium]|nr:hypothetical protein [Pontiellaceae bacterium]